MANANDMIEDEEKKEHTGFGDNLLRTMIASNKDKASLILSPLSVLIAMTVCMCGAQNNTLKQMLDVLYPDAKSKQATFENAAKITAQAMELCAYYNKTYNGVPVVKIANKLWIQQEFNILDTYIKATGVASVQNIDFSNMQAAADAVNKWCAENTNGMIKEVVKKEGMDGTKLLIANAIYFHGKFETPFPKKSTKKNVDFYADKTYKKKLCKVSMMETLKTMHWYRQNVNGAFDVVKLPYKSSKLALVLAIKKKKKNVSVLSVADLFSIGWKRAKINLFVPKFKFEYETKLNDVLKQMGITEAFCDSADFSSMTGTDELYIDAVIHKAIIEVDEEGTKAAAVTVVKMKSKSVARKKEEINIRFDHIFDFFVVDEEKKCVLFSGRFIGGGK